MAVVGIDIDGVIAKNPWEIWHWPFSKRPIRNRAIRALLASPCYLLRRPIPEAIQWIKEQQAGGNKVLLISGIYGIVGYFVSGWLNLWRVPFDGLYLRKNWHISQPEYKAMTVSRTGCTLFIDDRIDIIAAIAKQFLIDGFRKVRIFQNKLGYVVSVGDDYDKTEEVVALI